jgi:hypothetical protein
MKHFVVFAVVSLTLYAAAGGMTAEDQGKTRGA